jgi:hypothetical protein
MKPYMLFAGDWYYPSGGVGDFVNSFDSVEAAERYYDLHYHIQEYTWGHIANAKTLKIIKEFSRGK